MTTSALPDITAAPPPNWTFTDTDPREWSSDAIDRALEQTPSDLERPDKNGNTALHVLINGLSDWDLDEDVSRVRAILGLRNISLINRGNAHSMTPVHLAAINRATPLDFRKEVLQALLEAGADPNLANMSCGHAADLYEIEWLQTHSATPLFNALRFNGPDELIQLLITHGGEAVSIKTDPSGKRVEPLSSLELDRLAALTESVRQMRLRPFQDYLSKDVSRIVAQYAYPKGPN